MEHVGNQINATTIFARSDFVNGHRRRLTLMGEEAPAPSREQPSLKARRDAGISPN
jgi:hypothetical protein